MNIETLPPQTTKTSLLNKIIFIIFGIFIATLIFAFFIHYFSDKGIWLGLIFSLAVAAACFYFFKKGSRARLIAWGTMGTVIIGAAAFMAGLNFISDTLEKVI